MRTVAKKRLYFVITATIVFILGFQFIPEQVPLDQGWLVLWPLMLAVAGYFIAIPLLYWFWVIKAGSQKPWKLFIVFSLSCLCARYSFPHNIAAYFEFITYIRYPIIGILLVIELYLMVTIIKGLWKARTLSGDPRIHTFEKYKDDDKKLTAALPLSWEPASWYYSFPRFSRRHPTAITQLALKSASRWHWALIVSALIFSSILSYSALMQWSEITAIIVSSLFFYSIIFVTANHRVARHYSLYVTDNKLMINGAFLNFIAVPISDVERINIGSYSNEENKEQLIIGQGDKANVEIIFNKPQTYVSTMGALNEPVEKVWLNVKNPQALIAAIPS